MTIHNKLPRHTRLCTGVGLFRSSMHKSGLVPPANYRCGIEKQTADHILASCLLYHPPNGTLGLYHPPNGTLGLVALNVDAVDWLKKKSIENLMTRLAQTKKTVTYRTWCRKKRWTWAV